MQLSTPFHMQIPRPIWEDVVAHARQELPNECCGLIAGEIVSGSDGRIPRVAVARRSLPLINAAASPVEFFSEPRSMLEAIREVRRMGLIVLAYYHSHPEAPAVPSHRDLTHSEGPGPLCLIISLKNADPIARAWHLEGLSAHEVEWEFTSES